MKMIQQVLIQHAKMIFKITSLLHFLYIQFPEIDKVVSSNIYWCKMPILPEKNQLFNLREPVKTVEKL